MIILVCGGRTFGMRHPGYAMMTKDQQAADDIRVKRQRDLVFNTLYGIVDEFGLRPEPEPDGNCLPCDITIRHGGANGADLVADSWAVTNWLPVQEVKAQWDKYGKSAGYRRNARMLEPPAPDLVVAFPGGRGTANMVMLAKRAGIPVREITE